METFTNRFRHALDLRDMTQAELSRKTGIGKSSISQWYSGQFVPKQTATFLIAKALKVSVGWLMGYDIDVEPSPLEFGGISEARQTQVPYYGQIAAGAPLLVCDEQGEYNEQANINADYCLKIQGDSMIGAGIKNGDTVFIRAQAKVENGEIAAVVIDDEATLKRVYYGEGQLTLISENAKYAPMFFAGRQLEDVRVLGKAVLLQSRI